MAGSGSKVSCQWNPRKFLVLSRGLQWYLVKPTWHILRLLNNPCFGPLLVFFEKMSRKRDIRVAPVLFPFIFHLLGHVIIVVAMSR